MERAHKQQWLQKLQCTISPVSIIAGCVFLRHAAMLHSQMPPPPPLALGPGFLFCMEGMMYASYFACRDGAKPGVDAHIQMLLCCFQFSELLLLLLFLFQASPLISLCLLLQQRQHQDSLVVIYTEPKSLGCISSPAAADGLQPALELHFKLKLLHAAARPVQSTAMSKAWKWLCCLWVLAMLTYL